MDLNSKINTEYAKFHFRAKLKIRGCFLFFSSFISILVSYYSSFGCFNFKNFCCERKNAKSEIPIFFWSAMMMRPRFCGGTIVLLLFAAIVCANGVAMMEEGEDFDGMSVQVGKNQREFDYFALSMQWPPTFCKRTRHCCSSNACCRGSNSPRIFTIHGLWPDYNDGTWPACCSGHDFDPKEIEPLKDALDQYWPTLSCNQISNCHGGKGPFWAHEWEKHGTCSSPVLTNEYDYFLTTLNLYFKYNITSVLNDAGYVPSNTEKYPLGGIISAIENAYHVSPSVMCSKDAVQEIRICFYKDFKPRDCVVNLKIDMVTSKGSCPSYVSLPEFGSYGNDEFQSLEFDGDEAAL